MQPSSFSLELLYNSHYGWLRAWLQRRMGNSNDAADLAHDIFLRLLIKPASNGFTNHAQARSYLRCMANGMCINLWHRREIEQAWLALAAEQPEDFAPSAEHQSMIIEALEEISRLLFALPVKAAKAFLLSTIGQLSQKEIAEELGVSDRMVRKYIAQAMLHCMQSHIFLESQELC